MKQGQSKGVMFSPLQIMKEQVAYKSSSQGFNESRLPTFTEEEKLRIVGKYSITLVLKLATWRDFDILNATVQMSKAHKGKSFRTVPDLCSTKWVIFNIQKKTSRILI